MKLGVTTLGCPALDTGRDTDPPACLWLRGRGTARAGAGPGLDAVAALCDPAAAEQTRQAFADAGLAICGLDTSCSFVDADPAVRARNVEQGQAAIDLAAALGAPTVRVFGGGIAEGIRSRGRGRLSCRKSYERWETMRRRSAGTSASFWKRMTRSPPGRRRRQSCGRWSIRCVGALWDLHHPFRHGETPAETFAALRPYVKQTHVKDSKPGGTYCLLGEGDIPILEMLRLLKSGGYDGWINLEWEKRWIPELADPEIAFPQYAARLRDICDELSLAEECYEARRPAALP